MGMIARIAKIARNAPSLALSVSSSSHSPPLRHRDLHLFASIPLSNAFILVGIEKSHK